MVRPKKNNAEYFSHDADMRNDVKIKAIRRKFSHTGYAVWNYLLETLTDSDYFGVEWEDINIELLAADYDVTVEELQDIVEYCLKIGLLQQQGDNLYSEAHKKRFTPLLANRERKRRVMDENNSAETPENGVTASHNPAETSEGGESGEPKPHSKVKYSKVNNNIDRESKKAETAKRFTPPSIEEVQSYISEKEYSVDAESFVAFYTSKNWFVGKNKMKDWHAAIVTWEKRNKDFPTKKKSITKNINDEWEK